MLEGSTSITFYYYIFYYIYFLAKWFLIDVELEKWEKHEFHILLLLLLLVQLLGNRVIIEKN